MIYVKRFGSDKQFIEKSKIILDLNTFIHNSHSLFEYRMLHIKLMAKYALLLNKKLSAKIDCLKLEYISLAHDLLKERDSKSNEEFIDWNGYKIPTDNNRYVRTNLNILEQYGLDEYFNTDVQLHALATGVFLIKEMKVEDVEILYPVMFHSCPIIPVYEKLSTRIRGMVDIVMLSDKLSSNYLRINNRDKEVAVDLDQVVFGPSGREFNYTLGLLIARLISQGKSEESQSVLSTEYYHKRLCGMNPLIAKKCSIGKLGENRKWPKRKNQLLQTPLIHLKK